MDYYTMIASVTLFATVAFVVMHAIDRVIVTELVLAEMRKERKKENNIEYCVNELRLTYVDSKAKEHTTWPTICTA